MDNGIPNYEGQLLDGEKVHVRYRFGEAEMEATGPTDFVNQHAVVFLSHLGGEIVALDEKLSLPENSTPLLGDNGVQGNNVSGEILEKPQDLLSFYHKMAPNDQKEQVLVITYFYQKELGYEHLSLDDYGAAYEILRRVPVETPSNLKSSVRNVVDRTHMLFNPERGRFALTVRGEKLVQQMLSEK